jgi:mannosyl-oligosaccharide alpha-1,2-mannosidase
MTKEDHDIRFAATVTVSDPQPGKEDEKTLDYAYEGTHLTCFAGGMFAIGAKLFGLQGDMDIAAKLTDSCVWAYESTRTGIMPEGFEVLPCEDVSSCQWNETRYRHALDPYETSRIQQAEAWYQRQVQLAEESQERKDIDKSVPSPVPFKIPVADSEITNPLHSKRDAPAAEAEQLRAQDDQTPTKTIPGADDRGSISSLHSTGVVLPPKHLVLSHEDYVNARIKEERLPPGFTKIPARKYILRPEAIESVFIMFRLTGDNYWREKGWNMFTAITASTRTELADSAILDVTSEAPFQLDQMESFWLAETLKYFYLLFSDPSVVSLDEYIL